MGNESSTAPAGAGDGAGRPAAEAVLRRLAGPDAVLRDDQWRAIEALVSPAADGTGRRVLLVQRTGFGKSAVYFVATSLLRAAGAGPTVIVSPLLALMRNQIEAAAGAGIRAATINSANVTQWQAIEADIAAGTVDVLLVSPERLNNPDFRDRILPELAATTGLLVVDEAHCVSDWGHDFRPDYRRIATFLAGLEPHVPVLATTATANARVTADVAEQLGDVPSGPSGQPSAPGISNRTLVLRGPLDRDSLRLGVLSLPSPAHRLAWLADHLAELPGSGIIYTLTVAAADEVADFLRARGHTVAAYSGRTDPAERAAAEQDLLANRVKALVATSALGMGFDKPDLGFVVHLGAPASPIAYYQQVGRAGRAVEHAEVLLLPGPEDEAIWRYFGSLAFPPEDQVRATLAALSTEVPTSTPVLESRVELRRSRLELMLKVLDVDGAVRRVRGGWLATGAGWRYDTARYARIAAARAAEQQAMRDYLGTGGCRLRFLRDTLDDPYATDCGRCDTCRGRWYDPGVSTAALDAAQQHLGRPGVPVEPRKLWPTGGAALGIEHTGKIDPAELAAPGRALGRLSDIGWGTRLRALLRPDAADAEIDDEVFAGVIRVLADWPWQRRPAAVVAVPSRTRPRLVGSLARRLARVGRLHFLGELSRVGGAAPGAGAGGNAVHRLAAVHDAFSVGDELAAGLAQLAEDEPVLLVDDLTDTGWTLTVAARELRMAGAAQVLPFTLAVQA
ncbi:RecQ family ATP-dependent DNA helicase [Actinocatenispora thailandica]|uniref:RecQ family ATP-dependent DNA helicase n=1 Tax=Actinocatenispora thailandica TaxID=227318 RepID=UPI0031D6FD36